MRQEALQTTSESFSRAGAEEAYRLLVDCATEYASFTLDAEGRVAGWNAGAERLLGFPPLEIVGVPFTRFFTVEDVERGRPEQELAQRRHPASSRRIFGKSAATAAAFGPASLPESCTIRAAASGDTPASSLTGRNSNPRSRLVFGCRGSSSRPRTPSWA